EFAALPLLYGIDRGPQRTCVWFTDLRFRLEGFTPPFRYGMCREQDAWRLRRMARFSD
nr:metal-dependent hydrolase [Gammaproteobacteria bacterium]NIR82240.1 metal-dependent hydrolase [Gammaproteobacteria bacterium]NIU03389.1 metal-dependent hydrolase [Gammaproteobacteria bacterium]NIV50818.1 metal-dependent hydrolase [Gammaproteobacteria bacterium]NIV76412.1 metal-dependent hydrolase [Gammaproteobacteria bacterium]